MMWQPDDSPDENTHSWWVPNPRGSKPKRQLPRTGKLSRREKKERKAFLWARHLLKIRRRRRKFTLRNGFQLEVAWHYGLNQFVAEFCSPGGAWDEVHSADPKDLFARARFGIACIINPEIREVRKRLGLRENNAKVFTRRAEELSCNLNKGETK